MPTPDKLQLLRESLARFEADARQKYTAPDDRTFADMIVMSAHRLILALEQGQFGSAKLETLAFSRQLSDSYTKVLQSLRELASHVADIRRELVS
jgi:hypothetical protein